MKKKVVEPAKPALVIPSQTALVAASGGPPALTVKQVAHFADQMAQLEQEIGIQEVLLKTMNERLRVMKQVTVPLAMQEAQVKALTLPDGRQVEIEDFLAANITKEDLPAALAWLRKNKAGSIIKNDFKVSLKKGEEPLAKKIEAALKKLKVPFARSASVNYQTLQAFVKEKMQAGMALPPEIKVVSVPTAVVHQPKEK